MVELLDYRENKQKLRKPGQIITQEIISTPEFQTNLEEMKKILAVDGVGLAATQVNWGIQLFMLCIDEKLQKIEPQIFINPVIRNYSKIKEKESEGCLSLPGLYLDLNRPIEIEWEYFNTKLEKFISYAKNYYARAVMHEIDHLNGKLMIDYASAVQQLKIKKWMKG